MVVFIISIIALIYCKIEFHIFLSEIRNCRRNFKKCKTRTWCSESLKNQQVLWIWSSFVSTNYCCWISQCAKMVSRVEFFLILLKVQKLSCKISQVLSWRVKNRACKIISEWILTCEKSMLTSWIREFRFFKYNFMFIFENAYY